MPKSVTPLLWPSKLFTLCGSRYSRVRGLLFADANKCPGRATQLRLMCASIFNNYAPASMGTVVETDSGTGFLISPSLMYMPEPWTPSPKPALLHYNNNVYEINASQLYQRCPHLHKLLGCDGCPHHNTCLEHLWEFSTPVPEGQHAHCESLPPVEILQNLRTGRINDDVVYDDFVHRKTTIEDFTYITPLYTSHAPTRPNVDLWRRPGNHDFRHTHLLASEEDLSCRAEAGVGTRKHKRTECSRCLFSCPNWHVRQCDHGHWTQGSFTDTVLAYYKPYLGTAFTWEDVWRVAHLGGEVFMFRGPRDSRRNTWCVQGMKIVDGNAVIRCTGNHYNRRDREYDCASLKDLVALVGPQVLERKLPPLDGNILGLYLLCADAKDAPSYSCAHSYGFSQCTPRKKFAAVDYGRAVFSYWTTTYTRQYRVDDANDLLSWFKGHLPLFSPLSGRSYVGWIK